MSGVKLPAGSARRGVDESLGVEREVGEELLWASLLNASSAAVATHPRHKNLATASRYIDRRGASSRALDALER